MVRRPLGYTLFPYTTLFRSVIREMRKSTARRSGTGRAPDSPDSPDRKSTRLNSSHLGISYAVFCLKKKNDDLEQGDPVHADHDINDNIAHPHVGTQKWCEHN